MEDVSHLTQADNALKQGSKKKKTDYPIVWDK